MSDKKFYINQRGVLPVNLTKTDQSTEQVHWYNGEEPELPHKRNLQGKQGPYFDYETEEPEKNLRIPLVPQQDLTLQVTLHSSALLVARFKTSGLGGHPQHYLIITVDSGVLYPASFDISLVEPGFPTDQEMIDADLLADYPVITQINPILAAPTGWSSLLTAKLTNSGYPTTQTVLDDLGISMGDDWRGHPFTAVIETAYTWDNKYTGKHLIWEGYSEDSTAGGGNGYSWKMEGHKNYEVLPFLPEDIHSVNIFNTPELDQKPNWYIHPSRRYCIASLAYGSGLINSGLVMSVKPNSISQDPADLQAAYEAAYADIHPFKSYGFFDSPPPTVFANSITGPTCQNDEVYGMSYDSLEDLYDGKHDFEVDKDDIEVFIYEKTTSTQQPFHDLS